MSLQNRPVTFNDTKSVILALCPGKEAWVTLHWMTASWMQMILGYLDYDRTKMWTRRKFCVVELTNNDWKRVSLQISTLNSEMWKPALYCTCHNTSAFNFRPDSVSATFLLLLLVCVSHAGHATHCEQVSISRAVLKPVSRDTSDLLLYVSYLASQNKLCRLVCWCTACCVNKNGW